jgi:hypothetical protein
VNLKKFLLGLRPFLLAFVLPLLLVYTWWGGFNQVRIEESVAGPYTYAYLESQGDYSKLPDKAVEASETLQSAGIEPGKPITVLYSNPDLVDVGKRYARAPVFWLTRRARFRCRWKSIRFRRAEC